MNDFFSGLDPLSKRRLFNVVLTAITLLGVFLGVKVVSEVKQLSYVGKGVYPSNTVSVNGTGEVYMVPDVASFSFSVVEEGKTVNEAQGKATTKMNSILSALKEMGIEDKDVKTTGYNSYPKYDYKQTVCTMQYPNYCPPGKQVLTGYEVSQSITVKVRKTDEAGNALTKVGDLGASNISGLDFVVDDMDKAKAEAREKAVADAKLKAKALSKTLGVNLSKIVSFYESGDGVPPVMYAMDSKVMGAGMAENQAIAPQLPSGENKIAITVTVTYELE